MSDYTKITDFGAKDSLISGDPLKVIRGSEIDDEFDAIATAVASKYDTATANTALDAKANVAGDTFTGQIASSVATGTAPLSVASTTVVANLNADLLDGYNASQFAASSHTHSWDQVTNRHLAEGGSSVDANTTLYPNFLTNVNTPDGNYFHISQQFYASVDASAARSQVAVEYAANPPRMYCRQYYGGWSSWVRVDNAESTTKSFGATGYQKLPGGLILQWGTFTRTGADMYVYFPMVFPSACVSVVLTDMYSAALNDSSRVESVSTSYFYTRRADSSSFNVMYQAIGY